MNIAELRVLYEKATKGPWSDGRLGRQGDGSPRSQEEQLCNAEGEAVLIATHDGSEAAEANMRLIVAMHEKLPALLAVAEAAVGLWHTDGDDESTYLDPDLTKEWTPLGEALALLSTVPK